MAKKQKRPAGKPVGILVTTDEQAILETVSRKLSDASEPDKSRYEAALSRYSRENMSTITKRTFHLSYARLPQYAGCVDMALQEAVASTGTVLAWPSEDMANLCARLDQLPDEFISPALDLSLRICPDFLNDKELQEEMEHPRERIRYVYEHIPVNTNDRAEYFRELFKDSPYQKLPWVQARTLSFEEIMLWVRALELSPSWVLGWMDLPVLGRTAEIEHIMAAYSFLSPTLKQSFSRFIENLAEAAQRGKSVSIPPREGTKRGHPAPEITDAEQFAVYEECRDTVLSKVDTEENRLAYNISDALEWINPILESVPKVILDNPQLTEFTLNRQAEILGVGKFTVFKSKRRGQNLPMTAVVKMCDNIFEFSVHQLISAEIPAVPVPNWLGATAQLLQPYSVRNNLNNVASRIRRGMSDMAAGEDQDAGAELFYPEDESVPRIFAERITEIIEERYITWKELFRGFKWKFLRERAYSMSSSSTPKVITFPKVILFSIVTGIPEDCLVRRDYLRYLPAVVCHRNGGYNPVNKQVRAVLNCILRCVPEYRSKVLAHIWAAAYLGDPI